MKILCFITAVGAVALSFSWLIIFYKIWQYGGALLIEPRQSVFWGEVSLFFIFFLAGSINIWRLGSKS